MGDLIDLERKELIYRCNYVKLGVVLINLIGPPISLAFLVFSIIRMVIIKKRKSFLTNIILIIFSSEIIYCLSKMIQMLKYDYPNLRNDKTFVNGNTPRGIICQIQITSAIFSDFCSLFNTLLLSLRCYDVIKNKKRFFDKGSNAIISVMFFLILSLILAIAFLIIDRKKTEGNISYRYDIRDRCSYWCWLEHIPSLCCYGLYCIILFINIFFACKTNNYLKRGYEKLEEENKYLPEKVNDINTPLTEYNKYNDSNEKKNSNEKIEENRKFSYSPEDKNRIEQLKLMRLKCLLYPSVTIGYWLFATIYRIADDLAMMRFDSGDEPYKKEEEEREFFDEYPFFQFLVQFFFISYTFFSAIRGILYGVSFLVFEEKLFFNFFKKCCKRFYKQNDSLEDSDSKGLIRNTNSTSIDEVNVRSSKGSLKDVSNCQYREMDSKNENDEDKCEDNDNN